MGATRQATTHIFDECKKCKYRDKDNNECIATKTKMSVIWKRKTKKLKCPLSIKRR